MDEKWADVKEFEGHYAVSNLGRLKRTLPGKSTHAGRIHKLTADFGGYAIAHLSKEGKVCMRRMHRLVAAAFIPNPENLPQVNHIDGNKVNNSAENLEWCTGKENTRHAVKIGLTKSGETHRLAKLTLEQVLDIRKRYVRYNTLHGNGNELAKEYGVSNSAVTRIVNKKRWEYAEDKV